MAPSAVHNCGAASAAVKVKRCERCVHDEFCGVMAILSRGWNRGGGGSPTPAYPRLSTWRAQFASVNFRAARQHPTEVKDRMGRNIHVARSMVALDRALRRIRRAGKIALVPTMGAL